MKLIDKDALVVEIDRQIELLKPFLGACAGQIVAEANDKLSVLEELKNFLDTLEVKEVNLEKKLTDWLGDRVGKWTGEECENMCRYFFELGLEAQKDSIRHSMDETPNYPCDILFVSDVDNMFLFKYMENGRPVDRETPYFHNIQNGKCWYYCNDIMNVH